MSKKASRSSWPWSPTTARPAPAASLRSGPSTSTGIHRSRAIRPSATRYAGALSSEVKELSSTMNTCREEEGDDFYIYLKGAYSFAYQDDAETPQWESPMDRWLLHPGDGGYSMDVMSDGVMMLGSLFFEGDLDGKVGNIGSTPLREVWRSKEVGRWRTREKQTIGEPCASCRHVAYCKGGNFVQSLALFGDASIGDVRCPIVWDHLGIAEN